MPAITSSAPGKVILCGEHAVVYGQPAIALPVHQVRTKTTITSRPASPTGEVLILAPDIHLDILLEDLEPDQPLRAAIIYLMEALAIDSLPACEIRINTTIPLAAGLGSSASVTVSLVRALSQFLGHPLPDETVNQITFEVEKIHHGTPSGIDNTVITYQTPVLFQRGEPLQRLDILNGFTLVIADSGFPASTADTVAGVRHRWQQDIETYDNLFARIGNTVARVHGILRTGTLSEHGDLLTENHQLLRALGVSTPTLDALVDAAIDAGASGAKLSGGGGGGNVIAVATPQTVNRITEALKMNGAVGVIVSEIPGINTGQL